MHSRPMIVAALALICTGSPIAHAAISGVQWTPDSARILVNKDVGAERWAITLNLSDFSASGNVFFSDGQAPAFIWCEKTGDSFESDIGELNLRYRCFGSDRGVGGFALSDWSQIGDQVTLPLSFFVPEAETCDLRDALNGSNAGDADSFWDCSGSVDPFQFQLFSDGTGVSTATGPFEFDAVDQACSFGQLADGSYLDVEYSPSRDQLTVYEIPTSVDRLIVSECQRADL